MERMDATYFGYLATIGRIISKDVKEWGEKLEHWNGASSTIPDEARVGLAKTAEKLKRHFRLLSGFKRREFDLPDSVSERVVFSRLVGGYGYSKFMEGIHAAISESIVRGLTNEKDDVFIPSCIAVLEGSSQSAAGACQWLDWLESWFRGRIRRT